MRRLASASSVGLRTTRRSLTRRLWCDERLPPDVVEALWGGNAERLLHSSVPLQVKDRCVVVRHDHPTGPLLVKRHTWGGLSRTLRSVGREASARRCGRFGLFLNQQGIPTPLPRACLEQRLGPWGCQSYLVTDYVEGAALYRYIRFGSQSDDELRHVARQVASIWRRLVAGGISHNDMKPENFIVDDELRVWLIDLEKVRIGGNAERQRRRNTLDADNFLHMRGWHRRIHARAIFRDEFLRTPQGKWLADSITADEVDADLSVMIACGERPSIESTRRAIDSVRDIADEVALVTSDENGTINVLERIVLCGEAPATLPVRSDTCCPWMLFLHENESVTPFLAKEIGERIADENAKDAYRIPIEPLFFGRSVSVSDGQSVRLFRKDRCEYSLTRGRLTTSAEPQRTGELTGTVQQCVYSSVSEFVEQLNDQSTRAATQRLLAGDRAREFRALRRAAGRFLKRAGRDGMGSGWIGFQIALMEAVFFWVEEAKLKQMAREFLRHSQVADTLADTDSSEDGPRLLKPLWPDTSNRKAA